MSGTVERYGKGWRYRASIGIDPVTGKRRWVTKGGFGTRKAASTALNAVLSDSDNGMVVTRSTVTVLDYLDEWIERAERGLKPTTAASYRNDIGHLKRHLGSVRVQDLTPLMVERAYHQLVKSGLKAKSVRNVHAVLRRALGDAERLGLIVRNPAASARPPKPERVEQSTWTPAELTTFLEFVQDNRLFASFVLSATTGMRRGEVLGLRWRDVDLDAGRLSVVHTLTTVGGVPIESDTKTNKSRRRIALDAVTVEVLKAHRKRQREERVLAGALWQDTGLVFTLEDGSAVHPDRYSRRFSTLVRKAGVPRIRLHDVRHTNATIALEAGVHPKVVSERLGHATVGITLDLYSHVSPAIDEAAAETIAGMVSVPGHPRSSGEKSA